MFRSKWNGYLIRFARFKDIGTIIREKSCEQQYEQVLTSESQWSSVKPKFAREITLVTPHP